MLAGLSDYLQTFKNGHDTVYYLSKAGREYTGSKRVLRKNQFIGHILMRNEWFIYTGMPDYWKNEVKIGDSQGTRICDTLYVSDEYYHILEVDNTQRMKENREKIKGYAEMMQRGNATRQLGYFPIVVWLTVTEYRREEIKRLCSEMGLPSEVYTMGDIE